jgi:hypothetical protein
VRGCNVGITNGKGFLMYAFKIISDGTQTQCFMTIGSGIQIMLRILHQQFEWLSVGNTDNRDFFSTPFSWP